MSEFWRPTLQTLRAKDGSPRTTKEEHSLQSSTDMDALLMELTQILKTSPFKSFKFEYEEETDTKTLTVFRYKS